MKMIFIILLSFFFSNCSESQQIDKNINTIPMYGNVDKSKDHIKADSIFIERCLSTFNNKEEASKYYLSKGWEYFYDGNKDLAIKRFNQAWLLDSLNADIYWGFGNILGQHLKFEESIIHFEKSLKINPNNAKVLESAATSYGQLFYNTKNKLYLEKSIDCLKKSLELENNNARVLAQLAAAYSYFHDKTEARKYLKMADEINPNTVNPEVRKILNSQ